MASRILLLLLAPALVIARINIEISGSMTGREADLSVRALGYDRSVISDQEMKTFGLNEESVKRAANAFFGGRPDDVYLRSPTPWGDLYQSYDWPEVTRTLEPVKARVLKITSEPAILLEQFFENNSTKPATFNVGISQGVTNSIGQSWSEGGELTVGQEITYEIEIGAATIGGSTSFSYSSSWGNTKDERMDITVGATSSMELLLEPGQSVKAQLSATRGKVQIEVLYEAALSGKVVANYNTPFKDHHFWGLMIQNLMQAANMKNKVERRQVIEIGFYSDAVITVHDIQKNLHVMTKKILF